MLPKVRSCALIGLDGVLVQVEVDHHVRGLPSLSLVSLHDAAVKESLDRVRTAISNAGARFPHKRVTINLALADLLIAIAVLLASEQVYADVPESLLVGELSLDGSLRHTDGILRMVAGRTTRA